MTSDTKPVGGWPGAPGVPENPEQSGWHWLEFRGRSAPYLWTTAQDPRNGAWHIPPDWEVMPEDRAITAQRYLGPALLPADVAAREAAAREEGRLSATLDAPTQPLDDPQWDATDAAHPAWWRGNDHGVAAVVQIINDTLDGKPPGTYGSADLTSAIRRVAAAKAEGMREAMRIARAAEIPTGEGPRSAIGAAIAAAIEKKEPTT